MKKSILVLFIALSLLLLTACGSKPAKTVDLNAVMSEITSTCSLPEMTVVSDGSMLLDRYGIEEKEYSAFVLQISATGLDMDEIAIFEAKDAESAKHIAEMLEKRRTAVLAQTDGYLPDQYEMVSACDVETNGNYVSMFLSSDASAMKDIFKKALG